MSSRNQHPAPGRSSRFAPAPPPRRSLRARRRRNPGRGFTLLELMVVMAIISILVSMAVAGLWMVRSYYHKAEARLTMKQMHVGMINMKKNCEYDPMIPVGVYTSGRTQVGTSRFSDPGRDFDADGIVSGDRLYILGGVDKGMRSISGAVDSVLTVSGAAFRQNQRELEYFITRGSGEAYPLVDLGKELDPNNKAWRKTFTPHLNGRRLRYYTCSDGRIRDGQFHDPWGQAYVYALEPGDEVLVEKIMCAGADTRMGTSDDLEEIVTEIPFKE